MLNTVVIFGGEDSESSEARRVAATSDLSIATATVAGKPVHSGNAYQANGFRLDEGLAEGSTRAVIFECSPAAAGILEVVARCDHHNPGDTGYGLGSEAFFEASSLGQLMAFLGLVPTDRQRFIAASDHCPAAAYAGLCPDIDPVVFREHRLAEKVAFYATVPALKSKADPEVLETLIAKAVEVLEVAPEVDGVRDLRTAGFVDELPEAALRVGSAYMAEIDDTDRERRPTGNKKIVLGGHTTPETVKRFIDWAATLPNRVGEPYGNPTRGFAGVVVQPTAS
jgi:hypothetical protein